MHVYRYRFLWRRRSSAVSGTIARECSLRVAELNLLFVGKTASACAVRDVKGPRWPGTNASQSYGRTSIAHIAAQEREEVGADAVAPQALDQPSGAAFDTAGLSCGRFACPNSASHDACHTILIVCRECSSM